MGSACSSHGIQIHNSMGLGKEMATALLSPFRFSRDDAEKLLESAHIGSYLFSYDVASERFVSVSAGGYVCHHAISKQGSVYIVGGECFSNMDKVIEHYRNHPLGSVKLTRQFTDINTVTTATTKSSPANEIRKNSSLSNSKYVENENEIWKKQRKVSFKEMTPDNSSVGNGVAETELETALMKNDNIVKQNSVSSADEEEEEILLDEPIPILPGPSGVRPPPLFPRFSNLAEELAEFPFDSDSVYDSKQTLFQLYKGNPKLSYTPRLDMVKLIVTGQSDTYQERKYFQSNVLKPLQLFAEQNNVHFEYVDLMLQYTNSELDKQQSWSHEDMCEGVSKEINECRLHKIPYILLVYSGHRFGPLLVPDHVGLNDFETILNHLEGVKKSKLEEYYSVDDNCTPPLFVLDEASASDVKVKSNLTEIFHTSENLLKEETLWKYFAPGCERHLKEALCDPRSVVIFIERKFYDLDDYLDVPAFRNIKEVQYKDKVCSLIREKWTQICNQVENMERYYGDQESVAMTTSVKVLQDEEKFQAYCKEIIKLIKDRVTNSILSIQSSLKLKTVNDADYDEVLYHLLTSGRISSESTLDENSYCDVNKYIRGNTDKPLIIYGSKWSGKSSLLSRVPSIAAGWFNNACCIVCRFIGHTQDSSSLKLLLRNICVQISYAFSTDPTVIPQDIDEIIKFFKCLLDLPTDSLPLVLALDSLDLLNCSGAVNPIAVIPTKLQAYVKIVVTLDSENRNTRDNDIVRLTLPNFTSFRALEYLDQLLVKEDRTLNSEQQKVVAETIEKSNDPTFVRILLTELVSQKSSDETCMCSPNTSEGLVKIFERMEETVGFTFISAFCFAVSLDQFGIPKPLLSIFLKTVMNELDQVGTQTKIRFVMEQLNVVCVYQVKFGQIYICCRDRLLANLVHPKYATSHSDYVDVFKNISEDYFAEQKSKARLTLKQDLDVFKYYEPQYSFLQRFILRYGDLAQLKKNFLLNYAFVYNKLNCVSLFHVRFDFAEALKKYPDDYELTVLKELLELSKEVLLTDPSQLCLQTVCRLDGCITETYQTDKQVFQEEIEKQPKRICESTSLQAFITEAAERCHTLKPHRQCLTIPYICSNATKDEQSKWSVKDLKLMFVLSKQYEFVGWSFERGELYFYNFEKILVKSKTVENFQKVVLCMEEQLVVEVSHNESESKFVAFNMCTEEWLNIYPEGVSFTDIFHVFATDHKHLLFCLNEEMNALRVVNVKDLTVVWRYETDAVFHNIVLCKDASTAICYIDRSYETSKVNFNEDDHEDENEEEEDVDQPIHVQTYYEEIVVLDCTNHQQVMCLSSPSDHYCGKVFALSEDGQYFVRVTEVDVHLLVWNIHKGKLMHDINTSSCRLTRLLVSTRGNCIVSAASDSSIWVYNLADGSLRFKLTEPVRAIRGGYMDDAHNLCLSDDGNIAVHSVKSNFHPSFIVVWNLVTGTRLSSLTTDYYGSNYYLSPTGQSLIGTFPVGVVAFDITQS